MEIEKNKKVFENKKGLSKSILRGFTRSKGIKYQGEKLKDLEKLQKIVVKGTATELKKVVGSEF